MGKDTDLKRKVLFIPVCTHVSINRLKIYIRLGQKREQRHVEETGPEEVGRCLCFTKGHCSLFCLFLLDGSILQVSKNYQRTGTEERIPSLRIRKGQYLPEGNSI